MCKYRQVIKEIESHQKVFKTSPEKYWKFYVIEVDAIFKILKKKFLHHQKEISKENSHQYHSCMFWLNQMYLILEKLILGFRPDLNNKLDYNDESIMKPIRCIIDGYIKLIFSLIIFSQYNHQIHEICAYFSIINRIKPFMSYTTKSNSYIYFQKIQLIKAKFYIENCDYLNAMEALKRNIIFCYNYIRLLGDDDFKIYYYDNKGKKIKRYNDNISSGENSISDINDKKNRNNITDKNIKSRNKKNKRIENNININSLTKKSSNPIKYTEKNLILNISSKAPIKYNSSSLDSHSNLDERNNKKIQINN
jgi:hypothetical protein